MDWKSQRLFLGVSVKSGACPVDVAQRARITQGLEISD